MSNWQREIHEGLRRESWSLRGPSCVVKVAALSKPRDAAGGYITLGRFLIGKTPLQIEHALGLEKNELALGARVYRFTRLPLAHEYEYELTTRHPGGLAFNPAHSDPRYLPGSPHIHQWQIKDGIRIPVDVATALDLKPGQRFPYSWLT